MERGDAAYVEGAAVGRRIHLYAGVFGGEVASNILGCHLVKERSELHHIENVFGDSLPSGTGVGFFYDLHTHGNDSGADHFDFSCADPSERSMWCPPTNELRSLIRTSTVFRFN